MYRAQFLDRAGFVFTDVPGDLELGSGDGEAGETFPELSVSWVRFSVCFDSMSVVVTVFR